MSTTEPVPRSRWVDTLADFSHRHRGWLLQAWALPTSVNGASADVAADGGAGRELAAGVPLHAVELVSAAGLPAIVVHVCDEQGEERGQPLLRIADPRALFVETLAAGEVSGLRIDDATGHSTRLHFRVTAPTEMLDGLADTER